MMSISKDIEFLAHGDELVFIFVATSVAQVEEAYTLKESALRQI